MESGIYTGTVFHERFYPTQHAFDYRIVMLWLHLDEIDEVNQNVRGFSTSGFAPIQFKRSDYLGPTTLPLKKCVLDKMSELNGTTLEGDVFFLGQVRNFGIYFSPVNFYFLRQQHTFTHMLAEVSNTPWNERHYYLVDLDTQADSEKVFHVSPFNPIDMTYKWRIAQPSSHCNIALECHKQGKHFSAGVNLVRQEMNSTNLKRVITRIPVMTVKTIVGIYWQALRLWLKRTPIYTHPKNS